jgi:hypothetical protein
MITKVQTEHVEHHEQRAFRRAFMARPHPPIRKLVIITSMVSIMRIRMIMIMITMGTGITVAGGIVA